MNHNATWGDTPRVILHDHLDGGLRVETMVEFAETIGYDALPTTDPAELAAWFHQGESGSLDRYLAAFEHTVALMPNAAAVERVAFEAVEDLAADGVVYAELRFAPALHRRDGFSCEDVIEAALAGLERGSRATGIVTGLIASALRDATDSEQVAKAAARFVGEGVVGFDLAGPELGHPADRHLPAFHVAHEAGLGVTVHAGEADGPNSIFRAIARCGANRIGHGVHIVDDMTVADGRVHELGPLATRVRDHRIHLEVAVHSNVHTGFVDSPTAHPLAALHRAGFSVSINTDNRLMSGVSAADEYATASDALGLSLAEIGAMTEAALEAGFGSWTDRRRLIHDVVRPAYA